MRPLRHLQGREDQLRVGSLIRRPVDDFTWGQVQDDDVVAPAFTGAVARHVRHPNAIGRSMRELAGLGIVAELATATAAATSPTPVGAVPTVEAHQADCPLPGGTLRELLPQVVVDASRSVRTAA